MSKEIYLANGQCRAQAEEEVRNAKLGCTVTVKEPTRSSEQNRKMWAMLHEISRQVNWYGRHPSPDDWKDIFTAERKAQRSTPGISVPFVIHGDRTHKMSIAEMSELIELMTAFGIEHGVEFFDERVEELV